MVGSTPIRQLKSALAYDFAAGNVMQEVKANGTPWDLAKGLETFTHIGEFLAKEDVDPTKLRLTCKVRRVRSLG